ncbi:MAG: hypothetical protein ACXWSC_08630 [Bdellovibrionota bacterium]
MKKLVVFAVLMVGFHTNAHAMDHRSQVGVGGALGGTFAAPWASDTFRNAVSASVPAASAWIRYIPGTPEVGTELSYNYFGLGTMSLHTHTLIVSFISRQTPWGNFHPFYAFGFGYAKSYNKFATGDAGTWDDPVFKLTAGIEFEMNDRTDIGFQLNHYSIFKDSANQQNIHVLTPVLTVNYYFGTPAPLPPANAPAPTPTPLTPAATVEPTKSYVPAEPAPAPTSKSAKSHAAKKATKKKKKKKKSTVPPEATEGAQ